MMPLHCCRRTVVSKLHKLAPIRILRSRKLKTTFVISNQGVLSSYLDDGDSLKLDTTLILPVGEKIVTLIEDYLSDFVLALSNTGKAYTRIIDHSSSSAENANFSHLPFSAEIIQICYEDYCEWYYILTSTGLLYIVTTEEIILMLTSTSIETQPVLPGIRFLCIYHRFDRGCYLLTVTGELYINDWSNESIGDGSWRDRVRIIPFKLLLLPEKITAILGNYYKARFLTTSNRLLDEDGNYIANFVVEQQITMIHSDYDDRAVFSLADGTTWIYNYVDGCKKVAIKEELQFGITQLALTFCLTVCGKLYTLNGSGDATLVLTPEKLCKVVVLRSYIAVITESGKLYSYLIEENKFELLDLPAVLIDFYGNALDRVIAIDVEDKVWMGFAGDYNLKYNERDYDYYSDYDDTEDEY